MHPRDALTAAVNKAIANGAPVYVNQPPVFHYQVEAYKDGELTNLRRGDCTAVLLETLGFAPNRTGFRRLLERWNATKCGGGMRYIYTEIDSNG